jgi:ABC-type Fe3+ transport system substrate-binding protein
VTRIPVPPEANVGATYAAAIVSGTDQPAESSAFLAWLTGPEGQGALASFGFRPAP